MTRNITNTGLVRTIWFSALLVGIVAGLGAGTAHELKPVEYWTTASCGSDGGILPVGDPDPPECATPEVDDACVVSCQNMQHGTGSWLCLSAIDHSLCADTSHPDCQDYQCNCREYTVPNCVNPYTALVVTRKGCK